MQAFKPVPDHPETLRQRVAPVFRVACFGLAERFHRMMSIVLIHARQNRYKYVVADSRMPGEFDIALVDMTSSGGPAIASALQQLPSAGVVVRLGRRDDTRRGRDDLLKQAFTIELLDTLNRFVETQAPMHKSAVLQDAASSGFSAVLDQKAGLPRRPRALLVDDSAVARSTLAIALQRIGVDSDGVEAAHQARQALSANPYNLLIVEIGLPGESGFALARSIKRDPAHSAMPVVIFSARSSPLDLLRAAWSGCDSYLVKPLTMQALGTTVRRLLDMQLNRGGELLAVPPQRIGLSP